MKTVEQEYRSVINSYDRLLRAGKLPIGEERHIFLKRESTIFLKRTWLLWWGSAKIIKRAWSLWWRLRSPWRKTSTIDKYLNM